MATLTKTPAAQYALHATFLYDVAQSDQMANINAVQTQFKAITASTPTYDIVPLPYGAQVTGGDVTVLVVSNDTGAATVAVGDSASASRYLGATSTKALARTALVPTGYQGQGESLRITLVNTNGDATTGKVKLQLSFVIDNRQNENLKTT